MSADPRSLAAGRIALALVLLLGLGKRLAEVELWYSNTGLLPNHTVLWRPPVERVFSIFFPASHADEAAFLMVLCGVAHLALLVGYRTRLAHIASLIAILSLNGRLWFLVNGGDVVLAELTLWTAFLPTGRRFSVDSLRERLRRANERSPDDLAARDAHAPDVRPVMSLAVLAITVQLALIYVFNVLNKGGPAWREGSVVHYVLHQDRLVTALGEQLRGHMTLTLSRIMTWGALAIEIALPVAILSPIRVAAARRIAVALVVALHLGFALLINLGVFSLAMMAFAPNLIAASDWDALGRWWSRRRRARTVVFDGGCGICFQTVRMLARLDGGRHLTFIASDDRRRLPADLPDELLAWTIVVIDPETGRRFTRASAFAQILDSLPGGFLLALAMRLPGIKQAAGWIYDLVARNRTAISAALGMGACGVAPPVGRPGSPQVIPAVLSPLRSFVCSAAADLREVVVAILMIVSASQIAMENAVLPASLRHIQAGWMARSWATCSFIRGGRCSPRTLRAAMRTSTSTPSLPTDAMSIRSARSPVLSTPRPVP